MVTSWKINSIRGERKVGTEKEINRGKGLNRKREREIRGLGRLEAAYNYHFLPIKTFRCACAVATACSRALSINHQNLVPQPESYLFYQLYRSCAPQLGLNSLFTTALQIAAITCEAARIPCFFWNVLKPSAGVVSFSDYVWDRNQLRLCKVHLKKLLILIL